MATRTVTIMEAVRDWLLLVGEQYAVHEAHHIQRPDDGLKEPAAHFVFRFDESQQTTSQPVDNSAAEGSYDSTGEFYATFDRRLRIECRDSDDGMEIMEAVLISAWHPAVNDILKAASLVIVDMPDGALNQTTQDETRVDHVYTAIFGVRKNTCFVVQRDNQIWTSYTLTGTLTLPDDVTTLDITCTDT